MASKIITPVATLSYPTLFEPQAYGEGEPKYSAALVFPAGTDLTEIKEAIKAAAVERFGDKAKSYLQKNPPLRTDVDEKGYPEGSTFFNARTTRRPQIVSRYADPKTGKPMVIDEDAATEPGGQHEMYPGCQVKALISVYAYDVKGNRGVAFGLEGMQRWDEGERLGGGAPAVDVFSAEMPAEADIADLDTEEDADGIDDIL
jgi:hypothetical protein